MTVERAANAVSNDEPVLEKLVSVDGVEVPLWRALFDASFDEDENSHDVTRALLEGLGLSLVERLEVAIEIACDAHGLYGIDLVPLDEIKADTAVREWAPTYADRLLRKMETSKTYPGTQATVPLMLALVRNGIPLDPRWDALLPVHSNKTPEVLIDIWRAVPDARRDEVLLAQLRAAYIVSAYPTAALLAPALQSRACASFLAEHVDKQSTPPRAKVRAIVAAIDSTVGDTIATLHLHVTQCDKPRSIDDLKAIAREQLLAAMLCYDGRKLPLEDRLGEGDHETTGSVREGLERLEIDGDAKVEGFLYMGDSGTFFTAGTTDVCAEVIQGGLECSDPVLGAALRAALRVGRDA